MRSLLHYEIAVATLRGTGTLQPTDHLVRAFFSAALPSTRDLGLLRDCSVLHTYAHGAWRRHLTDITVEELAGWQRGLSDRVTTLLAEDPRPTARPNCTPWPPASPSMAAWTRLADRRGPSIRPLSRYLRTILT